MYSSSGISKEKQQDQDQDENNSDSEKMKYCGAEQCNIMCSEKEFCANTGKPGLCESVKCVTFNVWVQINMFYFISSFLCIAYFIFNNNIVLKKK